MSLQTARPPSPTCSSSLPTSLNFNHLPRPRKPRDTKPKMRKLKYHQYIPPDQRGGSGTGGTDIILYFYRLIKKFLSFVPIKACSRGKVFEFSLKKCLFPGGGAKQKSPTSTQSLDPAYSHLLKQQQVFLQLQILQNQQQQQQQQLQPQQQLPVAPRYANRLLFIQCQVIQIDPTRQVSALPRKSG